MANSKKGSKETDVKVTEVGSDAEIRTVKQALIKALVITGRHEDEATALKSMTAQEDEWQGVGAVDPILDPESMMSLYEISDSLRQNIDAYATNIEGNGHLLLPKIDTSKPAEAFEEVKNAMDAANWADAVTATNARLDKEEMDKGIKYTPRERQAQIDKIKIKEPTDAEVRAQIEEIDTRTKREMHTAKAWFRNVHPELSFLDLRERKRIDQEAIGRGYWEVRRDSNGQIRRLQPVAGYTVLPMTSKGEEFEVERDEWVSEIETRTVIEPVRFRRYVQRANGTTKYFKDLNDPRLVSDKTGKVYMKKVAPSEGQKRGTVAFTPDYEKMKEDEPKAKPATELVFFPIYSPKTPAGMARWAGLITGVIGNRAAAEADLAYFENHAIPDAALLIAGGQLNDPSVQRIQEALRSKTKGPGNHHRTLVIQASAKSSQAGQEVNNPDMEWVNLSDFQQGDALFQQYTENNKKAVSSTFRQALLLIGYIPSDLNRATALAVMSLVEKQVYGPLRRKFDWWVNNTLLPSIGVKLIKFESLSPEATNIEEMSKAIEQGIKGGAFTPNILLELYSTWLNRDFQKIEAAWGDVPFAATLAQLALDAEPPADEDEGTPPAEPQEAENTEERLKQIEKLVANIEKRQQEEAEMAAGMRDL